jgi:hypothetical protein
MRVVRSAEACVKRYLTLLEMQRKKPTPEDMATTRRKLEVVEERIGRCKDPLARLGLHQEAINLQDEITRLEFEEGDFEQVEEEFIEHVAEWAKRKKISYRVLRTAGVSAAVLHQAGMKADDR